MSKYSGYMDKVAKFDLSTGKLENYPWSDKDKELYIGGKAMAAKILFDNLSGKEEALSEENVIVITTGPLTGTGAPSSARFNISAVSPKTGAVASCTCGGTFGYYLKKAGYDALILTGKCAEHSWLDIYNDSFTLRNADYEEVWGNIVTDAEQRMHDLLDRDYGCRVKCGIVCCGRDGENQADYADIFSQGRVAVGKGMGAVFGAKNLKAICVAGNHQPTVRNAQKLTAWNKKWSAHIKSHALTAKTLPVLGVTEMVEETGKNCLSCPIKCGKVNLPESCRRDSELAGYDVLGGDILNCDMNKLMVKMEQADKVKAEFMVLMQNVLETINATGQCGITGFTALASEKTVEAAAGKTMAKLAPFISFINKYPAILFFPIAAFYHDREMKYAVGMKMNLGKYIRVGERGYTLEKYMESIFEGAEKACCLAEQDEEFKASYEKLMKAYYAVRGWSKEGVPTAATLKKLGIKKN